MISLLIIFIAGSFSALSMAPANFYPALFVGLSCLYISLHRSKTPTSAALTGLFFSLGYFGFSLSWIGNALLIEDNPYWWAWPLAVSGLPVILSIFTAISCYAYKLICKNNNNIGTYLTFTILLTISEYARGHLFTGFPWNLYGYTWIDILPIAQLASITDIYLLTFITILWSSAPAFLLTSNHPKQVKHILSALIIISLGASYIYGLTKINNYAPQSAPIYEAIVIQPNIEQSEKWRLENRSKNFLKLIELSKYSTHENSDDKKAYYIVWPETSISHDLLNSKWAIDLIKTTLQAYPNNAYLITGALRYDPDKDAYFNSIITFNNNAENIHTYNKSHLVPFGEYIPLSNIFNIAPIVGFTGFEKGSGQTTSDMPEGVKFSPLICYEVIFPNESISHKHPRPDIILNATNDAWYGNSAGPYQHLVQSKFRAIETGLHLVRSANKGITTVINPIGQSLQNHNKQEPYRIIHQFNL